MPPGVKEIKLKLKNDGSLDTTHIGLREVDKTDFVVWSLHNNSGLDSFKIVTKSGAEVFITLPHKNGNLWTAEINQNAAYDSQYSYAIVYWKEKDSTAYILDPIIAIKPSTFSFNIEILLYIIGGAILGLFGFWGVSSLRNRSRR